MLATERKRGGCAAARCEKVAVVSAFLSVISDRRLVARFAGRHAARGDVELLAAAPALCCRRRCAVARRPPSSPAPPRARCGAWRGGSTATVLIGPRASACGVSTLNGSRPRSRGSAWWARRRIASSTRTSTRLSLMESVSSRRRRCVLWDIREDSRRCGSSSWLRGLNEDGRTASGTRASRATPCCWAAAYSLRPRSRSRGRRRQCTRDGRRRAGCRASVRPLISRTAQRARPPQGAMKPGWAARTAALPHHPQRRNPSGRRRHQVGARKHSRARRPARG